MKALKTFVFLFTSLLCLIDTAAQSTLGQGLSDMQGNQQTAVDDEEERPQKATEVVIVKDRGLSLGVDISPIIIRLIKDERTGIAFIGRYGFKNRWFANAELGFEHIKHEKETYDYKSNGTFIRLGVDYDIFNNEDYPTNDNIFVGLRYAYAWQVHESENFSIVDSYWGDYTGSVGKSSVNSHSIDVVVGVRCEVLRNLYMGWSLRGRLLLASTHTDELMPYAIAGYGKYDNKAAIGFTYTIEYQIPFNRKK